MSSPVNQTRFPFSDRWYALRRSAVSFWLNNGMDNAAKLTFFTLLAFAPTLLSVYSIATLILANNREAVQTISSDFIDAYVLDDYQSTAYDIVDMVTGSSAGGIVGLVVSTLISLFSSSAYVRAFSRTANTAYGVAEGRPLPRLFGSMILVTLVQIMGALIIIAAITVNDTVVELVLVPLAEPLGLQDAVNYLTGVFLPIWRWLKWPIIIVLAMANISVLFHFAPNVKMHTYRWVSAGSIVAIIGMSLVGALFAIYLMYFTSLSSYGALGTVLAAIFALWGMNMAVVLGLIVEVETERVRQLRRGQKSERELESTLRSAKGIEFQDQVRDRMLDTARGIRKESKKAWQRSVDKND